MLQSHCFRICHGAIQLFRYSLDGFVTIISSPIRNQYPCQSHCGLLAPIWMQVVTPPYEIRSGVGKGFVLGCVGAREEGAPHECHEGSRCTQLAEKSASSALAVPQTGPVLALPLCVGWHYLKSGRCNPTDTFSDHWQLTQQALVET